MSEKQTLYSPADPLTRIITLRGQKVILDSDLAAIYGVETKRLNEQVRRNADRFPTDFMFQLTSLEFANLKSQFAISSSQPIDSQADKLNWSQIATSSKKNRGLAYKPYAFTEHGAIMAATVLNSPQAVQMSVFVVRAFVKMREQILNRAEWEKRLTDIEGTLMGHDAALRDLYQKIRPLLLAPPPPPRKRIGFSVNEKRARYRAQNKS